MSKRIALATPLLPVTLLATGCHDAVSPAPNDLSGPVFLETGTQPAIRGSGTLGTGVPVSGGDLQEFDFDVAADLTGRLFYRDWRFSATLTVDPADAETRITAFRDGSAACADPTHGAEFDATGRRETGALETFMVVACDEGAAGSGGDGLRLTTTRGYSNAGFLSSGDIVKTVTASPPPPAPVADFTFSCSALTCSFDASSSTAQATATYSWTWGDGTPAASGKTATHTYGAAGSYNVTLTVTDGGGSSSRTRTVTVSAVNQPPVASFTFSCAGLSCNFTSTSSDSDGTITAYNWTFGDGRTSTAQNPSHTYAAGGTYTVRLTVTDNRGATNATSKSVAVTQPNQAPSVNAGPDETVLLGLFYTLSASFSDPDNGPWSYTIHWGDGSSSSGTKSSPGTISAGHNYILIGGYTIKVTVVDSHGASSWDTKKLTVLLNINIGLGL